MPVNYGGSQTFTITPATGYHVADVLVDGVSVGAVTSHTISNVTANHTIVASFAINTYTLDVTATNGTVTKVPNQATYNHGATVELTATPATGYHFTGWSGSLTGTTNPATVTMDGNKTITAAFAINGYTIAASAGANGTITPSGDVPVNYGGNQTFTITPATGYHIVDVVVDGISAGPISSYLFTNVVLNHTITATFAINAYTIAASAGANGTITPSGDVPVNYGGSQAFTITPATGYHVADVLVDGVSVGAVTSHTISNVTANHTIVASFAINTYTLDVTATQWDSDEGPEPGDIQSRGDGRTNGNACHGISLHGMERIVDRDDKPCDGHNGWQQDHHSRVCDQRLYDCSKCGCEWHDNAER